MSSQKMTSMRGRGEGEPWRDVESEDDLEDWRGHLPLLWKGWKRVSAGF